MQMKIARYFLIHSYIEEEFEGTLGKKSIKKVVFTQLVIILSYDVFYFDKKKNVFFIES